jgi:hypothetical protein
MIMAKKSSSKITTTVDAFKPDAAKRINIPTAEYPSVIQTGEEKPKTIKYRRKTDLDPQLVWRGKDEQDWIDLVVHAPRATANNNLRSNPRFRNAGNVEVSQQSALMERIERLE